MWVTAITFKVLQLQHNLLFAKTSPGKAAFFILFKEEFLHQLPQANRGDITDLFIWNYEEKPPQTPQSTKFKWFTMQGYQQNSCACSVV